VVGALAVADADGMREPGHFDACSALVGAAAALAPGEDRVVHRSAAFMVSFATLGTWASAGELLLLDVVDEGAEGVGCDGEVAVVGVLAVADADGVVKTSYLDALAAVRGAVGRLAPAGSDAVHWSAASMVSFVTPGMWASAGRFVVLDAVGEGVEGVGCDGEVAVVGVLAVSDADGVGEASHLDAVTAVDVALGALAPLQDVHWSATSFINRSDSGRDSASARSDSHRCLMIATSSGSSAIWPRSVVSR